MNGLPAGVEEITVEAGGHRTRCLTAGLPGAVPLLLLHDGAWGGSAPVSWLPVIDRLTESGGFRIIAPDLLGFGAADKVVRLDGSPYGFRVDHVLAVLDALGVAGRTHVAGTSFGGSVALHLLAAHRERIASVISLAGTGGPWRTAFGRETLGAWDGTEAGIRTVVDVLAAPSAEFDLDRHVTARYRSACVPGHYRSMTAPAVALPAPLRSANEAAAAWPAPLNGIDTPVLLVHGTRDTLVEADWTENFRATLPGLRVRELDAMHSPNLDRPTEIAALIDGWVTEVDKEYADAAVL